MKTKTDSFIHVSTDSDCWGFNTDGFDCVAEARRIRDAAEESGVAVAFDINREHMRWNDSERYEIDWFSTWCTVGHEWSDEQWVEWFASK